MYLKIYKGVKIMSDSKKRRYIGGGIGVGAALGILFGWSCNWGCGWFDSRCDMG